MWVLPLIRSAVGIHSAVVSKRVCLQQLLSLSSEEAHSVPYLERLPAAFGVLASQQQIQGERSLEPRDEEAARSLRSSGDGSECEGSARRKASASLLAAQKETPSLGVAPPRSSHEAARDRLSSTNYVRIRPSRELSLASSSCDESHCAAKVGF